MPRDRSPEPSSSRSYERERDRDDYRPSRSNRSRSPDRRDESRPRRERSASASSSGSDDRRKHKSSRRDESKAERKERKQAKRERRRAKEAKRAAKDDRRKAKLGVISEYGKYGILTEADIYTKDAEFRTWLTEELRVNMETLPKDRMKQLFIKFIEDYNTATLPHEKYYALDAYENRMRAVRMGEDLPVEEVGYDPRADEAAAKVAFRKGNAQKKEPESHLSRDQLMELQKVQRERLDSARIKRLGGTVKDSVGVRYE